MDVAIQQAKDARMPIDRLYLAATGLLPGPLQSFARRVDPAFLRFGTVGAIGFSVDLFFLSLLIRYAGWAPMTAMWGGLHFGLSVQMQARFVSFPIAVVATWALNRNWTFREAPSRPILSQILSYITVQGAGGVANVGAYCAVLIVLPALQAWPIVPLVAGSAIGLCLTFVGSKYWAFRAEK